MAPESGCSDQHTATTGLVQIHIAIPAASTTVLPEQCWREWRHKSTGTILPGVIAQAAHRGLLFDQDHIPHWVMSRAVLIALAGL